MSERRVALSAREFADLMELSGLGTWRWDVASATLVWSERLCQIVGRQAPLTYGEHASILAPDADPAGGSLFTVLKDGLSIEFDTLITCPDGQQVWLSQRIVADRGADGAVVVVRGVVQDVSERMADRLVRERLTRLVAIIDDAVMELAPDGTVTAWNGGAARIYGYAAEEMIGRHVAVLAPAERRDEAERLIERIVNGEDLVRVRTECQTKDGRRVECTAVATPLKDGRGSIVGLAAVVHDATEYREAMRALVEREAQFRGVVDQGTAGVYILSNVGHVLYVNEGFARLCGYSADEVIGRPFLDFVPDADRPALIESLHATLAGTPRRIEAHITTREGLTRNVLAQAKLVQFEGQPAVIGVVADITDLKQMEFALQRGNLLLRTISAANEALAHADTRDALLQTTCDAIVAVGRYRVASIALQEPGGQVEIVAAAGVDIGELRAFEQSWDPEAGIGGPADAIRRGQSQVHEGLAIERLPDVLLSSLAECGIRACVYIPLKDQGIAFGSLGVYVAETGTFMADDLVLLTDLADNLAYGILALQRRAEHEASTERLQRSMEETIAALAATAEMRDPYTAGHERHVADLAVAIARKMGLDESRVRGIHLASIVHDIGKIKIPTELLTKPSRLTTVEEQLMQTHVEAGYDILKGIDFPWPIAEIVLQHHERLDGSGYPNGLTGSAIHLDARILAVADVVDAMSADRPYRFGKGIEVSLKNIEAGRGALYDDAAVDACLTLFRTDGFAFHS